MVPGKVVVNQEVNILFPSRFFVFAVRNSMDGTFDLGYTVSGYLVDEPTLRVRYSDVRSQSSSG
jgi:hypothetical protein